MCETIHMIQVSFFFFQKASAAIINVVKCLLMVQVICVSRFQHILNRFYGHNLEKATFEDMPLT